MKQRIQYCSRCGDPTGRCEEDSMYVEEEGPLCEECNTALEEEMKEHSAQRKVSGSL